MIHTLYYKNKKIIFLYNNMKNIIWPLVHKFTLQNNLCIIKYPWGWIPQKEITEFMNEPIPKTRNIAFFPEYWEEREFYHQYHFRDGARVGYKTIFNSYFNKEDFVNKYYTTPKLSLAINYFNYLLHDIDINTPNINMEDMNIKILGSWISTGNATTNNDLLGLWNKEFIKKELVTGAIGPEIKHLWDKKPIKQTVRVLYELNDRIDIWDWERCLIDDSHTWTVSNINNILV